MSFWAALVGLRDNKLTREAAVALIADRYVEWVHVPPRAKGATMSSNELDVLCISTIRTLAINAIQRAKSGHPGTPMLAGVLLQSAGLRSG